jgi:hypothetical protein
VEQGAPGRGCQDPQERALREGQRDLPGQVALAKGRHPVHHDLEAEEEQAEAEEGLPQVLDQAPPGEEDHGEAEPDEAERGVEDPEGQELDRQGRPDVRPEDDAHGLGEAHEPGRDEADEHHRGGGRRLHQGRDGGAHGHGRETALGQPRENLPEAPARGALEPLPRKLHPIQEKRHAAEEREQDHGGIASRAARSRVRVASRPRSAMT